MGIGKPVSYIVCHVTGSTKSKTEMLRAKGIHNLEVRESKEPLVKKLFHFAAKRSKMPQVTFKSTNVTGAAHFGQ